MRPLQRGQAAASIRHAGRCDDITGIAMVLLIGLYRGCAREALPKRQRRYLRLGASRARWLALTGSRSHSARVVDKFAAAVLSNVVGRVIFPFFDHATDANSRCSPIAQPPHRALSITHRSLDGLCRASLVAILAQTTQAAQFGRAVAPSVRDSYIQRIAIPL